MTGNTTLDDFQTESTDHQEETGETRSSEPPSETPICPCYREERDSDEWNDIKEEYNLSEPNCGHAISYLRRVTGAKIGVRTAQSYSSRLRIFVEFLHERDTTVTEMDMDIIDRFLIYLTQRRVAEGTLKGYRSVIANLLKHITLFRDAECSIRRELLYEVIDPADYNTSTEIEREPLSKTEAEQLFSELDSFRDGLIVQMGIELGPRSYDLRTIKLGDVDLDNQKVDLKDTKGGDEYTLPIGSDLALRLRHWIENERAVFPDSESSPYLFPSHDGGHLSPWGLNDIIKGAAEDAGIQEVVGKMAATGRQKEAFTNGGSERSFYRVTAHTLRHTFSDLLDGAGMNLTERSAALNHSSIEVTKDAYSHRDDEYKETMKDLFSNISISS